jgi:hypothetical protein
MYRAKDGGCVGGVVAALLMSVVPWWLRTVPTAVRVMETQKETEAVRKRGRRDAR